MFVFWDLNELVIESSRIFHLRRCMDPYVVMRELIGLLLVTQFEWRNPNSRTTDSNRLTGKKYQKNSQNRLYVHSRRARKKI